MSPRGVGLALAGLMTVAAIGLVVAAFVRTPAGAQRGASPMEAPLVVTSGPASNPPPSTVPDILQATELEQGRISLYDERGRLTQVITFDSFDPLEAGRFRVARPKATIHFPDGRTVEVRADAGQFLQRSRQQEPESGWFRGDVQVRLFDRGSGGAGAKAENAAAVLYTDAIDFDTTAGELRAEGPIRIESREAEWKGKGVTVLFSPKDRRLLFFRADASESLVFRPGARRRDADAAPAPPPEPGVAAALAEAPAPREDRYRAEIAGPVRVVSSQAELLAERLECWLRTFDGALRPGAVGPLFSDARGAAASDAPPLPAGSASPAPDADPVTVTWSGPLEIRPVAGAPSELAADDVFARLSSPTLGKVRFKDSRSGLEAEGAGVEYGATRRAFVIGGAGPESTVLRLAGRGEARASRIEADLARGIARIPGSGVLRALAPARDRFDDAAVRDVSWRGSAEIRFSPASRGVSLDEASFSEGVLARDGAAKITGESLAVSFDPASPGSPDAVGAIRRVSVRDSARADDGSGGFITADRLEVDFAQSPGGATAPSLATATGGVRAERDGSSIRAELIEARFAPDGARLDTLTASLGVAVRTRNGGVPVDAAADSLRASNLADKGREVAELSGAASIQRGPLALRAGALRIDAEGGRLSVVGPGEAEYTRPEREAGIAYDHVRVKWERSFTFDDAAGRAETAGAVEGHAQVGERQRDTWKGERLLVEFARRSDAAEPEPLPEPQSPAEGDLSGAGARVRGITLTSGFEEGVGEALAEVETRRFAHDPAEESGQRLESLVFVTGNRILADAQAQTFRVPAAGKLLLEDRREASAAQPNEPASPLASGARGTTLIVWDGSMLLRRQQGEGEIAGRVRLRHRPPGAASVADLECERLSAGFDAQSARLTSASAQGGLFVQMGGRQLTADSARYDATTGVALIRASEDNVVTLLDDAQGIAQNAREIEWDLSRDRIRVTEASPLRTGR